MKVGEEIRKIRKMKGLSQKALGEKAGMSQQQIAQYENNKRLPKLTSLVCIASALEIDPRILTDLYQNDIGEIQNSKTQPSINYILPDEKKLVNNFRMLNTNGKREAEKRIEELTEIPRYYDIESVNYLHRHQNQDTTPDQD